MHNNHHNIFRYLLNRELGELYASIAIRSFALSIISVFIPIYLYKIGFSLKSISLFYITLFSVFTLFTIFSAKIGSKIGTKHLILMSIPLMITAYFLLNLIQNLKWVFWVVPILLGMSYVMFWLGFHIDFSGHSQKKIRTEQIGGYVILGTIVSALGPFLGGLILTILNFKLLFIIGSTFLFISSIPLFLSKEVFPSHDFSFKRLKKQINFQDSVSFLGGGIEGSIAAYIWPIFMFIILGSFLKIGSIVTIALFVGLFFTIYISRVSDKKSKKGILQIGAFFNFFGWLVRLFFETIPFIAGITIFYSASSTTIYLPFNAVSYDRTNKKNRLEFLAFREMGLGAGRVLFFLIFFVFPSFYLSFILAAVGSLALTYIKAG